MGVKILVGDCRDRLAELAPESVHCVVTSVPYWGLRAYGTEPQTWASGWEGEHGQEPDFRLWVEHEREVWRQVWRVLRADGVAWLNVGDTYATGTVKSRLPDKNLCLLPERLALALQDDGWWVRARLPWVKRAAMPDSAQDRPGAATETVFLLTKSARYFYDAAAVRQVAAYPKGPNAPDKIASPYGQGFTRRASFEATDGRGFRNADLFFESLTPPHGLVSDAEGQPLALGVNREGYAEAHFATFPPKLVAPLIKAGTSEKGACAACGAPWTRDSETTLQPTPAAQENRVTERAKAANADDQGAYRHKHGHKSGWINRVTTLGWSPGCGCDAEVVPCTVLDPFGGAGTTGLVADRLGRDALLVELNPDYAAQARERIHDDAGLFADVSA